MWRHLFSSSCTWIQTIISDLDTVCFLKPFQINLRRFLLTICSLRWIGSLNFNIIELTSNMCYSVTLRLFQIIRRFKTSFSVNDVYRHLAETIPRLDEPFLKRNFVWTSTNGYFRFFNHTCTNKINFS